MATIRWRGRQASEAYRQAAQEALGIAADALLTDANQTVPIEEATLERSGATFVDYDARIPSAVVSYDTPYAVVQHEDTRLRHDPGRRAKWLEHSLKERARDLKTLIGREIKRMVP